MYQGSEKAWRFLSAEDSLFKLGLAVSIVPAAEFVITKQFQWQSQNAHLDSDVSKLPLVQMANMQHSPAMSSINWLIRALLHHDTGEYSRYVKTFMHLQNSA